MNQHGLDGQPDELDRGASHEGGPKGPADAGPSELPLGDSDAGHIAQDKPIAASLADTTGPSPIRVGSPFAVDPAAAPPSRPIEPLYDVGPVRYTAIGAVAASVMVLGFAAAGAWWFPAGGALVAALGCVLSIFGLYSTHRFRLAAVSLLAIHLCLFVFSYSRSLG